MNAKMEIFSILGWAKLEHRLIKVTVVGVGQIGDGMQKYIMVRKRDTYIYILYCKSKLEYSDMQ